LTLRTHLVPKTLFGVTHDGPWFLSGLPVRASFKPCPWRPLSIISDQIKSAASSCSRRPYKDTIHTSPVRCGRRLDDAWFFGRWLGRCEDVAKDVGVGRMLKLMLIPMKMWAINTPTMAVWHF